MNVKKLKNTRRRLPSEYKNLIKSINRNRIAEEEMRVEKTEDESHLARTSHERDLLYNLHEGRFSRLRFIQDDINA